MSEFNYLTGRPELFENAPDAAMVVLEHDDGRMFYAVAHDLGANYWNEDGTPGSKVGLIALHKKTRVIARRSRIGGLPKVEPKRDPIPKSRLDRMQKAQNGLKKAISQPAPVKPKPEPMPAPVKVDPPRVTPKKPAQEVVFQADGTVCRQCGVIGIHACMGAPISYTERDKQRLNEAVKQIIADEQKPAIEQGGFVSIYALGKASRQGGTFINIHSNGNISLSAKLPIAMGDTVDVQFDRFRGLVRVGKVEIGGKALPKSRVLTSKALVQVVKIPEGEKSIRIQLTEADGWWQGQAEMRK